MIESKSEFPDQYSKEESHNQDYMIRINKAEFFGEPSIAITVTWNDKKSFELNKELIERMLSNINRQMRLCYTGESSKEIGVNND